MFVQSAHVWRTKTEKQHNTTTSQAGGGSALPVLSSLFSACLLQSFNFFSPNLISNKVFLVLTGYQHNNITTTIMYISNRHCNFLWELRFKMFVCGGGEFSYYFFQNLQSDGINLLLLSVASSLSDDGDDE